MDLWIYAIVQRIPQVPCTIYTEKIISSL